MNVMKCDSFFEIFVLDLMFMSRMTVSWSYLVLVYTIGNNESILLFVDNRIIESYDDWSHWTRTQTQNS